MKFYIFILLVCLINSCAEDRTEDMLLSSNYIGTSDSFDIITWNIEWFPKNIKSIDYIAEAIIELDVDILGLQEITSTSKFNLLISTINGLDSANNWVGFRSENSEYQELAYLINLSDIQIIDEPYTILKNNSYSFAFREPFLVKLKYKNNEIVIINSHFKCCGDGNLDFNSSSDEENRRYNSVNLLKEYIDTYLFDQNVILIGDFNDDIAEPLQNNVFQNFLSDTSNYSFVDYDIASTNTSDWSYPSWPSHLDHILITNELFDDFANSGSKIQTLLIENYLAGGWNEYETYISDHRPVALSLYINP